MLLEKLMVGEWETVTHVQQGSRRGQKSTLLVTSPERAPYFLFYLGNYFLYIHCMWMIDSCLPGNNNGDSQSYPIRPSIKTEEEE